MLHAIQLRTEYLVDPIGIDILRPRFYWLQEGTGQTQQAEGSIISTIYGRVSCDWERDRDNEHSVSKVTVPPGTTVDFYTLDGVQQKLSSGNHTLMTQ